MNKPDFNFILTVNAVGEKISDNSGSYILTLSPKIPSTNGKSMQPLQLEITKEQFDAMRFHFMTAVDDKNGITKIAYFH